MKKYSNQWYADPLHIRNVSIALLTAISVLGCNKSKPEKNEEPLARVYDKYLYVSDVDALVADGTSAEDSARIVQDYIDNWIRQNLILRIAEDNLQTAMAKINEQAEEYKESLVLYAYERQFLAENLDTVLVEDSMRAYYESHSQDFLLRTDIYRLAYVVVPRTDKSADSVNYWFSRGLEKYRLPLERYCVNHSDRFSLNTDIWLNENDLFTLLPYDMYANGSFRTKAPVTYSDTSNRYFAKVEDFFVQGSMGPYAYFRNDIHDIIINKRKKALLDDTYQRIYTEGMKRDNAEIIKKEE